MLAIFLDVALALGLLAVLLLDPQPRRIDFAAEPEAPAPPPRRGWREPALRLWTRSGSRWHVVESARGAGFLVACGHVAPAPAAPDDWLVAALAPQDGPVTGCEACGFAAGVPLVAAGIRPGTPTGLVWLERQPPRRRRRGGRHRRREAPAAPPPDAVAAGRAS
ncbi:hypothetical protein [Saccharopolyspora cebuensis]|uniref:Uncharacterized protein n=1 Tax=Saccharopolyspora cebuensis TaxID=418759 RepID=A0ABV4CSI8_9PSEU